MKNLIIFFIISLAAIACSSKDGQVESDDMTALFNGNSFDGWTIRGGGATYEIKDGAIVGINGPEHNTFLSTWDLYSDFVLEFDVKLNDPMNSGVQIRSKARWETVDEKEIERVYGPQVEIEQSPGESGYVYGERAGGWMTPKEQLVQHSYFKNDDWNHYKIVADGPRIQTWINGTQVSDLTDEEIYKDHKEGFIGLQVHRIDADPGTRSVAWKNIRIRELNTDGKAWKSLFNGENLDGWTVKVTGYDLGENPGEIFRVENGVMKTSYEAFDSFDKRFGHIFYKDSYSHYKFRLEYRFYGEQCPGGPDWALRNSGIMAHGQTPESMTKDQNFPNSIEMQILGGDPPAKRTSGNLCTPGTDVIYEGELRKKHCTSSTSKTYPWDEWVQIEVHVNGSGEIVHFINGNEVIRYTSPQLDDGTLLESGTISIQAESHGGEFRNIEIMEL
ncbi:MAG: DUF1080 domain-containing protein [Verrucomicrobia bacterium]|nr:DUF1080 domain-containing protein [Verrucomicrobiota bacterium]